MAGLRYQRDSLAWGTSGRHRTTRRVDDTSRRIRGNFHDMQVYTFSTKNRVVALLAALVVLGAGAALLLVGLALLAGVAVVGGVLGTGVLAYRALRGQKKPTLDGTASWRTLDPSLEVFPEPGRIGEPEPNDDPRRIGPE